MIHVGVIGCGYWGPNLIRNFHGSKKCSMDTVSDLDSGRLSFIKEYYPDIHATLDCSEIFKDPKIDAVAIATPAATHYELAKKAIESGKHVFVEKPMTMKGEQAEELISLAEKNKVTLMVDHTFVYTGAIRKIKKLIANGDLGSLYYYDSQRVNLGLFQGDVDVFWDLAIHDLYILDYLIDARLKTVSATGLSHVPGAPENSGFITLFFEENFIAHINVNWLSPVKIRRTLIGGSKKMVVFDDLDPSEKIKLYDTGINVTGREDIYKTLISYRTGDMWAPKLDRTEALQREIDHFATCIETGETPLTDGISGLKVVKILEAASASMHQNGTPMPFLED